MRRFFDYDFDLLKLETELRLDSFQLQPFTPINFSFDPETNPGPEDNIDGDENDNVLTGTAGDDVINGFGGNDTINGLAGDDIINGGDGDDVLIGGAGADALNGGAGNDTASYVTNVIFGTLTVNLSDPSLNTGDAAGDIFSGIENITGSSAPDRLFGNEFDNVLTGHSADDYMDGGAGNDTLLGGDGYDILMGSEGGDTLDGGVHIDTVDYTLSTSGVMINLTTGMGVGGYAQGDTLLNIENVIGSAFADSLNGSSENEFLNGGDGDDQIFGLGGGDRIVGGSGADILDGGDGIDALDYTDSDAGVTINLSNNTAFGGHGTGDIISNFEHVYGSDLFDDIITGSDEANILLGNGGNDMLFGGDGDDELWGQDGDDILNGGLGDDYIRGGNGYNFVSYADSPYVVDARSFVDFGIIDTYDQSNGFAFVNTDEIHSIQGVIGSDHDDFLNVRLYSTYFYDLTLNGGDGDDLIRGAAGNDTLIGGDGDDFLRSNRGIETMDGGDGFDRISFYNLDATEGVIADLRTGIVTNDGFGNVETFANIEGLGGGTVFVDYFDGDDNANLLLASGVGDVINGHGGHDEVRIRGAGVYDGGVGVDTLTFNVNGTGLLVTDMDADGLADRIDRTVGAVVDLSSGQIIDDGFGHSGTAVNFENLSGTNFNDQLYGTNGNNTITGLDGNDRLYGDAGNDRLYGDAGNDVLEGGDGDDIHSGGLGVDRFVGGAGADVHLGGGSIDTVDYRFASSAVIVDLANGGTLGDAAGDTYFGVERVLGSTHDDIIIGASSSDNLHGREGNDYIYGGDKGNDSLFGEAGDDSFGYHTATGGKDQINDYMAGALGNEVIYILGGDPAFDSFAEVMAVATDVGGNTVFNFGGRNTLTIIGRQISDFDINDFDFSGSPPAGNGGNGQKAEVLDAVLVSTTESQLDAIDAFAAYEDGFAIFEAFLI